MIKIIYKKKELMGFNTKIDDIKSVEQGMKLIQKNNKPQKFYGIAVFDVDRNVLYVPALNQRHAKSQIIDVAILLELNINHVFEEVRIFPPFFLKKE